MGFVTSVSQRVTDVHEFLMSASKESSLRYRTEKDKKHYLYIPYEEVEVQNEDGSVSKVKRLLAISGKVHEWYDNAGKYNATVCIKDVVRTGEKGELLNDGSCPYCDRVSDAWEIYKYRKELAEADCILKGEEKEKFLKNYSSELKDQRKARESKPYIYLLVVQFRMGDNGKEVLSADNLPEYDLKVMKLSTSRMENIQQQVNNAEADFEGVELVIGYPNLDDSRQVVRQSTTTVVFPDKRITKRYKKVLEKIQKDVEMFSWEGIENAYKEWAGSTVQLAKTQMNALFEMWDRYVEEKKQNPNAIYMEYMTSIPSAKPSLSGNAENVAPTLGGGDADGKPVMPNVSLPDINDAFAGGIGNISI